MLVQVNFWQTEHLVVNKLTVNPFVAPVRRQIVQYDLLVLSPAVNLRFTGAAYVIELLIDLLK